MVETAIYVLIGALTTALLALIALPAVSRRAYRLAQARARLAAPLSAAEVEAERDAMRGRHAVELTLAERRADAAQDKWAAAQITLGERTADIVRRDLDIADKAGEIARQRAELMRLGQELTAREADVAAHETALRDFEGQRDAAQRRFEQTTATLKAAQAEFSALRAGLEMRIEELTRELSLTHHRADSALFAAKATIADLERQLEESQAQTQRIRRQVGELALRLPARDEAAAASPDPVALLDDRLIFAAARERDLSLRLQALADSLGEAQTAMRAARADRDEAERESAQLRERAAASEARAARLSDGDDDLRQAIARLGRELVEAQMALVDSPRETAS